MPVYIIHLEGEPDAVKIGYTADISRRIAMLQTATWRKVVVLRVLDGGRDVETWFHNTYKERHIVREWFRFIPCMLSVSPTLDDGTPLTRRSNRPSGLVVRPKAPEGFHADVIRNLGGVYAVARGLGLTKHVLTKWPVRGIPSRHWPKLLDLCVAKGVAVTIEDLDRNRPQSAGVRP